jgi:protein-disulfide isomerase
MNRKKLFLAVLALPLSLAVAACGGDAPADEPLVGEPIAHIAPPEGQTWLEVGSETPQGGYVIGNPDAPLKLVEFASHTCSHCAHYSQQSVGPFEKYLESGVVSHEIRNQIHDALDLTMAMLVRCGDPAAFHPLADQAWGSFDEIIGYAQENQEAVQAAMQSQGNDRFQRIAQAAGLIDFFAARGIARDQAMQCLADPAKAEAILNQSQENSNELDVQGTPTFFLNGRRLNGTTWDIVEPALQQAGAR